MMLTKGLRALFSLLWVAGLMCGASDVVCEDHQMDMALNLNVTQHAQGFSLAPMLLSKRDVTVSVRLLVRSEGAAGSTTQRQSRNLSLQAGVVMAVGKIGLGLRCPYRVEVTALIWQNERLLVEKKEQMACAG
ncbi:hypothetical protein F3H86_12920 [Aeromonas veronii]|nr:hypothetical protein [Aeromonas veronii]MBE8739376.1 hypothetical protein [Aeromonas veronii]MBE8744145.1 hypothetical protein [Aeromonas veronii]MBE8765416.1 hypothetical protein [Aeromonas veronii]MBE8841438.1 hypothetical protein [Aeromonas veronii]